MKRLIMVVLSTLAAMSMPAAAAIRVEFPTPGVQYVRASPGGSATMTLRIINDGSAAVAPVVVNGTMSPYFSAVTMLYTSLDPVGCPAALVPADMLVPPQLRITIPSLAAGEVRECVIRVDRPSNVSNDDSIIWLQPSNAPSFLTMVIGARVVIHSQAELLSIDSSSGQPVARVRVTTNNDGELPVIGVGFQTCGFVTVTPAPTNGCPAIPLPGTDFLCAPLLSEQTFGSPPVPAGGSASCEILISGIGPSTQLPSSVAFYRASRMLTPDGREVLDSAQLDDSLFLNVNLGVSAPVPAFGLGAMMVLALMLFAIAARRRRREFSQRR